MKLTILLLCFYLLPATRPFDVEAQAMDVEMVRVSGVVSVRLDGRDAVIPEVALAFESEGKAYSAVTDDSGEYALVVPRGTYTVHTSANGYCGVTRAAFGVKAAPTVINLYLYTCAIANLIKMDEAGRYAGEECRVVDSFSTDRLEVRGAVGEPCEIVIRYGARRARADQVVYGPPTEGGNEWLPVMASYDTYTVYADEIEYDAKGSRLDARGNVQIDANGVRTTAAQAQLDIGSRGIVVRQ